MAVWVRAGIDGGRRRGYGFCAGGIIDAGCGGYFRVCGLRRCLHHEAGAIGEFGGLRLRSGKKTDGEENCNRVVCRAQMVYLTAFVCALLSGEHDFGAVWVARFRLAR